MNNSQDPATTIETRYQYDVFAWLKAGEVLFHHSFEMKEGIPNNSIVGYV